VPSHYNACEFCQGTVAQMLDGGAFVSDAIEEFGPQIAYVHFRNVQGAKKSHF
jgi:mannonate dehydratase